MSHLLQAFAERSVEPLFSSYEQKNTKTSERSSFWLTYFSIKQKYCREQLHLMSKKQQWKHLHRCKSKSLTHTDIYSHYWLAKVVKKYLHPMRHQSNSHWRLAQLTWSKSCLPVVLGWMANSSSASIVVTRTLICRVRSRSLIPLASIEGHRTTKTFVKSLSEQAN